MTDDAIKELLENAEPMMTWSLNAGIPVGVPTLLRKAQTLAKALRDTYTQLQRWRAAAMPCPQSGKTGPCVPHGDDRRCFKCGAAHPEEALKIGQQLSRDVKRYDDARQLVQAEAQRRRSSRQPLGLAHCGGGPEGGRPAAARHEGDSRPRRQASACGVPDAVDGERAVTKVCKSCHHAAGAHGGTWHCDGCGDDNCWVGGRVYSVNLSYDVSPDTPCTDCGHTAQRHHDSTYCMSCADCDCPAFSARGCLESPTAAERLGLRDPDSWKTLLYGRLKQRGWSADDYWWPALDQECLALIREIQADAVRKAGGFNLADLQNAEIADLRSRLENQRDWLDEQRAELLRLRGRCSCMRTAVGRESTDPACPEHGGDEPEPETSVPDPDDDASVRFSLLELD